MFQLTDEQLALVRGAADKLNPMNSQMEAGWMQRFWDILNNPQDRDALHNDKLTVIRSVVSNHHFQHTPSQELREAVREGDELAQLWAVFLDFLWFFNHDMEHDRDTRGIWGGLPADLPHPINRYFLYDSALEVLRVLESRKPAPPEEDPRGQLLMPWAGLVNA